ncbi:MAG: tRNA-guanine transglycosylase, partial [Parapedobacter sp.]
KEGIINIKNKKWEADFSPIDATSDLLADRVYTKAYLRHLIRSQEILGAQIASLHNLHFYLWLVGEARKHILAGDFLAWKNKMVVQLDERL